MILVFSNKSDVHCNPVIRRLTACGAKVLRVNTECLMTEYQVTFAVGPDGLPCLRIHCIPNGIEARSEDVTAVWERRPRAPEELPGDHGPDPLGGELRNVALQEAAEFARWIRNFFADRPSIGSAKLDEHAECKFVQAARAASAITESGCAARVRLPETIVSNDPERVREFALRHQVIAIKPVTADGASAPEGGEFPFLTKRVSAAELLSVSDEAFRIAPNHAQPYVEKHFESRITMVDQQAFPCRIDTQHLADDRGRIDWRAGYGNGMRHSRYEPPDEVARFCRAYLRGLGLRFGCFDFIVDPSGTHWFLECNPNGQWLWIQDETAMPIAEAIADALACGARTHA